MSGQMSGPLYVYRRVLPAIKKTCFEFCYEICVGFSESQDFGTLGELGAYFFRNDGRMFKAEGEGRSKIPVVGDAHPYKKTWLENMRDYWKARGDPISWHYDALKEDDKSELMSIFQQGGFDIEFVIDNTN